MPGGIRSMLAIYRAMLVDAEQNRQASRTMLEMPVLALGGDAFIAERNEKQMKQFAPERERSRLSRWTRSCRGSAR